jgi:hypothetical protein
MSWFYLRVSPASGMGCPRYMQLHQSLINLGSGASDVDTLNSLLCSFESREPVPQGALVDTWCALCMLCMLRFT